MCPDLSLMAHNRCREQNTWDIENGKIQIFLHLNKYN